MSVSYNNLSVEKQFAIAKQKQGIQGLQGIQGINGKDGISGKDGQDGKTSYFHIKYSSVANPTSSSQMSETPSTYIGTYVDYTEADSDDPGKYTWSRFEGKDGAQGSLEQMEITGKHLISILLMRPVLTENRFLSV